MVTVSLGQLSEQNQEFLQSTNVTQIPKCGVKGELSGVHPAMWHLASGLVSDTWDP